MIITQRPFSGPSDIRIMSALAQSGAAENLHIVDLPYRLNSWALDNRRNVSLWVDESGRLLAWAVVQTPFWTIDYVVQPEVERPLHQLILDWADRQTHHVLGTPYGHPSWYVMVYANQRDRMDDLEAAGFSSQAHIGEDSWSKVFMRRSADRPLTTNTLPAGFSIRALAGESEVDAYVELHQAVFESKNMTAEWRSRTLRSPEYRPELDLVAVAPDGQLAGFCVGWLGRRGSETAGQIEPLGVRRGYRSLGLAWGLLSEALRRLHENGAENVYVETDNYRNAALGIYQAVGFEVIRDVLVYRKDYE